MIRPLADEVEVWLFFRFQPRSSSNFTVRKTNPTHSTNLTPISTRRRESNGRTPGPWAGHRRLVNERLSTATITASTRATTTAATSIVRTTPLVIGHIGIDQRRDGIEPGGDFSDPYAGGFLVVLLFGMPTVDLPTSQFARRLQFT